MADPVFDPAMLPRRLHDLPDRWAHERPDAPAIVDHDGRELCYRELGEAIESCIGLLREAGVRPGDRVMVVNENAAVVAAMLFAIGRLEAWAVLLNARLAAPEIDQIAEHCRPRALVFTHEVSAEAGAHADRWGATPAKLVHVGSVRIAGRRESEPEPVHEASDQQVAALVYTSGTTGKPKGVMLSHRNMLFIAVVSGSVRGLRADDRVYAVLPISHIFGLASTFLGTMRAGGTIVFAPRFDPARLAEALAGGVSVFQGVPPMYAKLLDHLDRAGLPLVAPRLRYMSSGGAPLDLDWKRRVERRFGLALNNGYGLTECSPTVSQTRIEDPRTDDSVGPPLPGVGIRFVDPSSLQDVAEGSVGECWVSGPNIMMGYYRDPQATAATLTPDGWCRTGDLGYRSPDGNLFLVGRCKELIIRSGFNVYPPEVETALNTHPEVVQSAVVGRRVDGNEEILAFIERKPGSAVGAADLDGHLRTRLAAYKLPQHTFVLDKLPAGPTGKILKHQLVDLARQLLEDRGAGRASGR